ncbi:GDYXXLXY domain-containing protein [Mesorhizobium microcysteis]|uniref:GDYXXLXY domain-containing protein n=1 Tax=Neoaquamicrobium microcysteis TaxID=2682781 RepID=A0A5D4GQ71_9HYPH|nr:GDYXXLXY domain-containing protein [Mesorhizobium microcysteis]TYR31021.1 GDYXXLXY domain-containing protein [Mesorhizobium microcysteis]
MSDRRRLLVIAAAVALLQIALLVSMIAGRAAILRNGEEVTLSVMPVDPRDLLRGDYVVLGYNISSVPTDLFAERPEGTESGERRTVFVRLKEGNGGIWEPMAARYEERLEPVPGGGEVDIRGTASAVWFDNTTSVSIDYGIERFYVPEGEGRAIEADMRQRQFRMKVAVASDGTAQIKSFHDEEKMLYSEPLF